MKTIDPKSIKSKIVAITSLNPSNYYVNYYRSPLKDELLYCENKNSLIFLQPEFEHYKLYYATVDFESLEKLFNEINAKPAYMEIISAKGLTGKDFSYYLKHFDFTALYIKMKKSLVVADSKRLTKNTIPLTEIFEKLYLTFDRVYSHLITYEQLEKLNENGNVLSVSDNGQLKGFIIFRLTGGSSAVLDFIANYGTKSHLIELWQKFYEALNFFNVTDLSLWCSAGNKKALIMYGIENFSHIDGYNCFFKLKN